ncbi:MAG: tripartite tricarboxylate transporter permease [Deltaproteobacteria bacterium]|nr:tripartite tricarboxylate transporter permease [Deltaproteobacteria bacterium]
MLEAFVQGLVLIFQWPAIGFLLLGILIGLWLGAVPGLGPIIGLVLLLPFTFDMEPVPAIALLLGMFTVTSTADTIASVLLGVPGTVASQATILDGYPLAKAGHAARALGAAFTVSAFGGVFGALVLSVSLPLVLPLILAFSKAELFMLAVLGLTMVGSLTGRSVTKGLTVALFGLIISTVGYGDIQPVPRFHFGIVYLLDGLPLIPMVLGLFAVPELLELAASNTSISRVPHGQAKGGGLLDGVRDACRHWWLVVRCSVIGTYVGLLPGLGGQIVDWVAYGHAVQSAKDKSRFGQGDIRGVIAPEAANNAIRGGALVPTIAFGIPGSLGAAILLGAFLIQGLQPGPDMLTRNLPITYSLVWTIVVANLIGAGFLMLTSRHIARLAFIPGHLLVPGVLTFVLMGSWLSRTSVGDWVTVIVFGFIGYVMKRGGWPRPPFVLALILGGLMEQTFQISMAAHRGPSWLWERPIVMAIAGLCVLTIFFAARGIARNRKLDDRQAGGEGTEVNPIVSLPLSLFLSAVFAYAVWVSPGWPPSARQFPMAIAVPGLALALGTLLIDVRQLAARLSELGGLTTLFEETRENFQARPAAAFFGYLVGVLLLTMVLGQKMAVPIFITAYLVLWGRYRWRLSVCYALGGWAVLVAFYDRIVHLFWHPSWLSYWLPELLPAWLPAWLLV